MPPARSRRILVGILLLTLLPNVAKAQIGLIDDLIRAGVKAAKAGDVAGAGARAAFSMTDDAGRLLAHAPPSAASRAAYRLSLPAAAAEALHGVPSVRGRLRVYIGKSGDGLAFVRDANSPVWDHSRLRNTNTLPDYLASLEETGQVPSGIDYVLEADVVNHSVFRDMDLGGSNRFLLANYGGPAWPLRRLDDHQLLAEVTPSMLVRVSDEVIGDLASLLDMTFDGRDLRVVSLFDAQADMESIARLRTAASQSHTYQNVESAQAALDAVGTKRGQIVTLVGHVEEKSFVVLNARGAETFRIGISELNEIAKKKNVSLILLGCETGRIPGMTGLITQVNSIEVAEQLHRALSSHCYGDFLSALGTAEAPLVVSTNVIDQARVLVAQRFRRAQRAERAGVTSAYITPELARDQAANAQQLFRSLPRWMDNVFAFVLGIIMLAFLGAIVTSLGKRSLSPIKTTTSVIIGIVLFPALGLWTVGTRMFRAR